MQVARFGKPFHSKTDNWKYGLRNPAWHDPKAMPDVYVLRFYGNADRAERWPVAEAEMWNDRAVEIWGMNYPGFGGSTGPARLSKIGPAALVMFDELKRHAGDTPIVPFGTSIGVTAALHVAASRPAGIAGLILQNPPPLREMILRRFGWWNLWLLAGSYCVTDSERPGQHCKCKSDSFACDFLARRER